MANCVFLGRLEKEPTRLVKQAATDIPEKYGTGKVVIWQEKSEVI